MRTSDTNEAVAIASALRPTVDEWERESSRSCVRAKKMTVAVPLNHNVIGVKEAFSDTVQTIPAMGSLGGLNEGDPVWVMWLYGDKSTMVAMWPGDIISGGAGGGGLPNFTYTGTSTIHDDGDGNWRIKFLSSGLLTMDRNINTDIFMVGGGASGGQIPGGSTTHAAGGGGGGYTRTETLMIQRDHSYWIEIGAGGVVGATAAEAGYTQPGGATEIRDGNQSGTAIFSVSGGDKTVSASNGGKGGSGGGAGASDWSSSGKYAGAGGSNGGNGSDDSSSSSPNTGGVGQGTTTREFGELTGDLYAGGGGGGQYHTSASGSYTAPALGGDGGGGNGCTNGIAATNGQANTGGGGGGGSGNAASGNYNVIKAAGNGGSGILIIRNHRTS